MDYVIAKMRYLSPGNVRIGKVIDLGWLLAVLATSFLLPVLTLICSRMRTLIRKSTWTCQPCLRARAYAQPRSSFLLRAQAASGKRPFTIATQLLRDEPQIVAKEIEGNKVVEEKEQGALSRRLSEMAEETMNTGSKSDRKLMSDAGFSEELKDKLEERIAQSAFATANQRALSEANMPASAGKGTRDQAAATPWTGSESVHDSTLRMLDDSHKRLRTPARIPKPVVNLRPAPKKNISAADRLAKARDKTSIYAVSQQEGLTDEEREKMRKELKDRFSPGARPMPTSLQGLTSLANERIEDAIARGQFKNIARGKGVNIEKDYNANSPFIDTTEYFMNKIIQKQEIVPPWIEKQQELMKLVGSFRSRLRNDWKRHAARSIASIGGSVDEQVRRARGFALTEEMVNPRAVRREGVTGIDPTGNLTTITIEERIAAGVPSDPRIESESQPQVTIRVTESPPELAPPPSGTRPTESDAQPQSQSQSQLVSDERPASSYGRVLPTPYPFRDPQWEATESAYHSLAITEINALTRSYNLMAPKLAQKPYYNLQRELSRCYSDVAPLIADEILDRSRKPKVRVEVIGHREGGVMSKFDNGGHVAKVRDEDVKKGYGFKEFWRDLFSKEEGGRKRNLA